MKSAIFAFAALVATPLASLAQPAFDCAQAESSAEELICADLELARLDQQMARRFDAALTAAAGLEAGADAAVDELRATQRGWIKERDECWKAADPRACVEFSYLRREADLVASWFLEEPSARSFWTCGGNPANEVVTTFFETELPGVRIERGDRISTATLSPTGSGARYEGSFGRYIWIKGDEATYREADPDGSEYVCTLASGE